MNKNKEAEAQILGQPAKDTITGEFYMHKIKNTDTPETRAAMAKADAVAARKTELRGKYEEPDYSPQNLIRLGAKEEVLEVPYVLIHRLGAKDKKSHRVTEEHKQQFPEQWAKFEAEHYEYFHKERDSLRTETNRQLDHSQGSSWQGGVNYTPSPYTITFG